MSRIFYFIASLAILSQCTITNRFQNDKALIINAFNKGDFTSATALINDARDKGKLNPEQTSWLIERQAKMDRIRLDFSKSEKQIKTQLSAYYPILPDSLISAWVKSGHLEMRVIDGVNKYFKYSVPNLFRLDKDAAIVKRNLRGVIADPLDSIKLENTSAILSANKSGIPVETRVITLEYSIKVDADAVPAGEEVHCWLPFPRESMPRQTNVILLEASPADLIQSGHGCLHSSLYGVKQAISGLPTEFSYKASFEISGQWFNPVGLSTSKATKIPANISVYTREEPPHVSFTDAVKHLADSLASKETNPVKIIRSFYYWIDGNIPWASALEYSTFECIPDYVLQQRHGDCGMKTFLLMSMARYKGIPARWQSGWMLHPGEENLHDWCELWFADAGWVPVDMSFGLQSSTDITLKEFYFSGIDSYRMIVNDGFAQEFDPPKIFFRSEPYDFQRGEVEWAKGNLYFNQWDYKLNVVSIEKKNQ